MPVVIPAIIGAAGAIGGAAISGHAAGKAADTQASAANYAATLQKQSADQALAFQKQQYADTQANQKPFLQAGQGAITQLSDLMKPGGELSQGYNVPFTPPTGLTEQNDPGFQARLQMGQQAIERSAAARGGLLTGGTGKALERYGQDYASNEYGNVYNRALQNYQTGYNVFSNNQANLYNRLSGLAGGGQVSANQLASSGTNTANNVGNILLGSASNIGQQANNAAAARASGYVGGANAYGSAIGNIGNNIGEYLTLQELMKRGNSVPTISSGNPYMIPSLPGASNDITN